MPARTVTVELPSEIYDRLRQHAVRAQRPIEAELLDVILTAVQQQDDLPGDLSTALEQLKALDSQTLVQMAQSRLSAEEAAELEALNLTQQRSGLAADERQRRDDLLHQYERCLLVRAEAAALLKERGYDVAMLLQR